VEFIFLLLNITNLKVFTKFPFSNLIFLKSISIFFFLGFNDFILKKIILPNTIIFVNNKKKYFSNIKG
jgi:hypothetical protein